MDKKKDILGQELDAKTQELESQREEHEHNLVLFTLDRILGAVKSKDDLILNSIMEKGKGLDKKLQEIIWHAVQEAAEGDLMSREYRERRKSEQRVIVYNGRYWEKIDQQMWQHYMNLFTQKIGIPESFYKDPAFMKKVWEQTAFTLFKWRNRFISKDEVWLNMRNGTLVIRSDGSMPTLRDHCRDDMFFYALGYDYNPQADCPMWHAFLDRNVPEAEAQTVLAEFIGYALTRKHFLNKMLWMIGAGANGKSVVLEIIEALLGAENVSNLSLSDLTGDPAKRVGIEGKLLNISYETGKEVRADVMKLLSAGEPVTVKFLYEDPYTTRDYGQFAAAFNMLPKAEITGAFFRRLIVMPFDVIIPEDEQDKELAEKLKREELPGILNWVIKALQGLMQRKAFTRSEMCEKALAQYRMQSDSVSMFVHEMCEKQEYTTRGDELFSAYKKYCYDSNLTALGKGNFYKRLDQHTHSREDVGRVVYFHLKLVES